MHAYIQFFFKKNESNGFLFGPQSSSWTSFGMRLLCNGSVTEFHWECERGDMDRAKAVLDLLHLDDDGVRSFPSMLGLFSF